MSMLKYFLFSPSIRYETSDAIFVINLMTSFPSLIDIDAYLTVFIIVNNKYIKNRLYTLHSLVQWVF